MEENYWSLTLVQGYTNKWLIVDREVEKWYNHRTTKEYLKILENVYLIGKDVYTRSTNKIKYTKKDTIFVNLNNVNLADYSKKQ